MGDRISVLVAFAALAVAAVACGGETTVLSNQPVLSSIPWTAPETWRYQLLDGDEVIGTAALRSEEQAGSLSLSQSFDFPQEGLSDEVVAVVDADTLQPQRVERTISGSEGERRCEAAYAGAKVVVDQRSSEGERHDELDVPTRSYDSWADLFLWRTLAFAPDYEVTYRDVLSCTLTKPQVIAVTLKVEGRETVSVPAGTFEAWRLEVRSGGQSQTAWYANDAVRTLVRYDNGELVFELESE